MASIIISWRASSLTIPSSNNGKKDQEATWHKEEGIHKNQWKVDVWLTRLEKILKEKEDQKPWQYQEEEDSEVSPASLSLLNISLFDSDCNPDTRQSPRNFVTYDNTEKQEIAALQIIFPKERSHPSTSMDFLKHKHPMEINVDVYKMYHPRLYFTQDQDVYVAIEGLLLIEFDPSLIYTLSIQDKVKPR